ncbi:MAG: hypothetical protein GY847_34805 [Proteobacteria bacterium]|nr:hypothetical protein [Pseudomonadota bacterium]
MASNSPNPFATYCLECVAAGRTEWACSATVNQTDPTDPELVPIELTKALTESSASASASASVTASACVTPDMMAGIQVTPLVLSPRTTLIVSRFSPFYSELGYRVSVVRA